MAVTLNGHSNGASRLLVPGMYAPLPTFYLDNDEQGLGESWNPAPRLYSMVAENRPWCVVLTRDLLTPRCDHRYPHPQETRHIPSERRDQTPSSWYHG